MAGQDISPKFLFHGSQAFVEVLEPRPARGVGDEKDRQVAVYATHERNFAILFALPIRPDENGNLHVQVDDFDPERPRAVIHAGRLDLKRTGILYTVGVEGFEAIDAIQWVSSQPVRPVCWEVIQPQAYLDWIEFKSKG